MSGIESFKDLDAYRKGYQLALQVYRTTRRFPREELYGITSQLRRAAISVPSNIAEGYRRRSRGEYVQFLHIAYGSCGELETQLDICRDLDFVSEKDYVELATLRSDVSKMLYRLIQSLGQ
jgi:four helix bundle protein